MEAFSRMDSVSPAIAWCREQQAHALSHFGHEPGSCDHPQCTPRNVEQYLLDCLAEEIELTYPEVRTCAK
jgi:hypothetical protein